ncbi:PREDICTED: periodic tryptophan protein 1 homolog [Tarenaya hassleriana]|uniref:periodic tryptophan protein 1 homolog n=1 Tax=Tarenaya hassleriana TaxID=28532 RepID=UPI00053C8A27|nr:PREDICTED: periodic tryptophan protein 1 homolog [Tarenaya hassleriana]
MISSVSWVPKGASKSVPAVAELPSKDEIEELIKNGAFERSDDAESNDNEEEMGFVAEADKPGDGVAQALTVAEALGKSSKTKASSTMDVDDVADGLKELDMDNYDEEDDGVELFSTGLGDLYYPSNEMDPYLKNNDEDDNDDDDDDSEDLEDLTIKASDSVIVCARNEDEVSHLEVYVYEESGDGTPNMFVHHDIILPEFPLCTAWLDCPLKGGEKGNFIAIGSMGPSIEIWDLDIVDEVLPCVELGGIVEKKKKSKKKKSNKATSVKYKDGSHTGSVLGLAWNKEYRNILASASADKQVKIWDVAAGICNITSEHHTDKVQAVAWNHFAPQVLLSGSFDHTVVLKDGRNPSHSGFKWSVMAEVESLAWDPHTEHSFVVSLNDGTVKGFDIRSAQTGSASELKPSFTLHAHDKEVTSVSYNPSAPNLLATGSMDKMVKLWDLSNNQPSCIASQNPKAGAVFSTSFCPDRPFLLAIGGSKGKLQVWDTLSDASVSRRYRGSS